VSQINSQNLNSPRARNEIEFMKGYSAPLEGRRGYLRLDFNENTIGPSPRVIEAIRKFDLKELAIYPEYMGIKKAFIQNLNNKIPFNKIKIEEICMFNGVDAAIHSIFLAYGSKADDFLTTTPTFGYYYPCANMQGMNIINIPYENNNFNYPLENIYKILLERKPKILMICNPNNPTGTKLSAKEIFKLAKISKGTLIVIDELYEAFDNISIIPEVNFNEFQNIIVLRSLSKTAGLAGLRIGFAIGAEKIIKNIKCVTGPYDINSIAVEATFAALKDQAYIDNYVQEVINAKHWLKDELIKYQIKYHINGGNYFLLWPKNDSLKVEKELKERGILVRNMKGKNLINGSIRVSIGSQSQMKKFLYEYIDIDQVKEIS